MPNPISTSAFPPPRFHGTTSNQPPTPLYPFYRLRLLNVAVNLPLQPQPSLLKNKTDDYVSLFS